MGIIAYQIIATWPFVQPSIHANSDKETPKPRITAPSRREFTCIDIAILFRWNHLNCLWLIGLRQRQIALIIWEYAKSVSCHHGTSISSLPRWTYGAPLTPFTLRPLLPWGSRIVDRSARSPGKSRMTSKPTWSWGTRGTGYTGRTYGTFRDKACPKILGVTGTQDIQDILWRNSVPLLKEPRGRLNIKTVLSTYGDFHVKDKTAVRTSYL